jgi:hypothetical protein
MPGKPDEQPEHDPVPSPTPTEPGQEVPTHDPPVIPERARREVLFDENKVVS